MKHFITFLILSISAQAFAALTPVQENVVLKELNNYCSDSWCESATDFQFQHMECSDADAACVIYFTTQDNSTSDMPISNQNCRLNDVSDFSQMMVTRGNSESGYQSLSLKDQFVRQMDRCAEQFFN